MAYSQPITRIKPEIGVKDFRRFEQKTIKAQPQLQKTIIKKQVIEKPIIYQPPQKQIQKQQIIQRGPQVQKTIQRPVQRPAQRPVLVEQKINRQIQSIQLPAQRQVPQRIIRPGVKVPQLQPRITSQNSIVGLKNTGKGKILIMIAAGPSANEINFEPIKNNQQIDFMCINKPFLPVWPSKYWAFCDQTQYKRNKETWEKFEGIIINSNNVQVKKSNQYIIENKRTKGFSLDITAGYNVGRSSTYANMQVANYMNYDKVYIFGIDMCEVNGSLWHYGTNPDISAERRKKNFADEAEHYKWAGEHLSEEIRKKFYFCSSYNPFQFINKFNYLDHKIAINKILGI